jgi:hypothetical protein
VLLESMRDQSLYPYLTSSQLKDMWGDGGGGGGATRGERGGGDDGGRERGRGGEGKEGAEGVGSQDASEVVTGILQELSVGKDALARDFFLKKIYIIFLCLLYFAGTLCGEGCLGT